ncbi:MAG TPA: hypothetical protein VLZ54_09835, partial [Arenibacter sp.]|nr:hypothetical protein [Arenibacter sp.]
MKQIIFLVLLLSLFHSCSGKRKEMWEVDISEVPVTDLTGAQLAQIHCSGCHLFVAPELLPRSSWENDVLPAMAHRLGLYRDALQRDSLFDPGVGGDIMKKADIFPEKPLIAGEDWNKIVAHYLE